MSLVKLSGKFPENGGDLDPLLVPLIHDPERRHVVVLIVDTASTTIDHASGAHKPTAGIAYCEPITDDEDIETALEMLARHRAERTGSATLDFDFGVSDPLDKLRRDMKASGTTVSFRSGATGHDSNN